MTAVILKPSTDEKLEILSTDAQYDLACACGTRDGEHRRRGGNGKWIYPVTLPNGGTSVLFKTLMSNNCHNDCKYCPLRAENAVRRCNLGVDETARVFLDYFRRGEVFGLFLSSGVCGTPDATMERLNGVARRLRQRYKYRGYIHLKVIPGASDAAVEEAVSLATAVSLNIETPGAKYLAQVSQRKDFMEDIIRPIKLISRLTGKGMRYSRVKQTTQFIVGAAGESDAEIVRYMGGLYGRLGLQRVYFSAYQRGLGDPSLPGEAIGGDGAAKGGDARADAGECGVIVGDRGVFGGDERGDGGEGRLFGSDRGSWRGDVGGSAGQMRLFADDDGQGGRDAFMREHRLYQVDFLLRRYGFKDDEIVFDEGGRLSLDCDPKEVWARRHPEAFPVDVNRASKWDLLRVPGLGPRAVERILERREAGRLNRLEDVGKVGRLLEKARGYLVF